MTLSKESPCKEYLVKWHHVIYSSITSLQDCYAFNKLLTQITIKQKSMCNGNHIWLLSAHKPIAWEASVHRKERCFNQKSRQPGEKVDSCSETNSQDSFQPWHFLKGNVGETISVNRRGRRLGSVSFSIVCKLADSLQMFSCPMWSPEGLLRGWIVGGGS